MLSEHDIKTVICITVSLARASKHDLKGVDMSNSAATRLESEMSLADYVAHHARLMPSSSALIYLGTDMSYSELNKQADRLACVMKLYGVGRGSIVGIHLPNTPQYLLALVAASKLGAVVSGVSPLLTAPEVAYQVQDAGISLLLTLDGFFNAAVAPAYAEMPVLKTVLVCTAIDSLPAWKRWLARVTKKVIPVTLIDMPTKTVRLLSEVLSEASVEPVSTQVNPNDPMYIQYTGGTTGKPKGAVQSQQAIFASLDQLEKVQPYSVGEETVASAFPYFHMAGLSLAVLSLRLASRILVFPDPRQVEQICLIMQKYPPTLLTNVPTLYQMMMDCPEFSRIDFQPLKMAVSGAAPFSVEQIHRLEGIIGLGKLCEGYGMTETSGVSTINPLGQSRIGSIGKPLPDTKALIVDVETGTTPLPCGEPGELILQGQQIMSSYLNNSEATDKALRRRDDGLWLHTGDVAVMDADGYITIVDRAKDMLIVGGYKVFSVEVECKLAELPEVALSALIGQPDLKRPGNDIVHLYVQLSETGKSFTEQEVVGRIMAFCRKNMAAYKIPKEVHILSALPLTAVGKLDKKALRVIV